MDRILPWIERFRRALGLRPARRHERMAPPPLARRDRGMALKKQIGVVGLGTCLLLSALGCATPAPVPQPDAGAAAPQITRDVVYGHKDGMALVYDVFKP